MNTDQTNTPRASRARASMGVPGLDDVLSGGLPTGHVYLIEGDPGTGKTTIGLQFLRHCAAHGERVLHVTLSESKNEIAEGAESHGWDLNGIDFSYSRRRSRACAPRTSTPTFTHLKSSFRTPHRTSWKRWKRSSHNASF
jgi:replicative DNA helicase